MYGFHTLQAVSRCDKCHLWAPLSVGDDVLYTYRKNHLAFLKQKRTLCLCFLPSPFLS